LFGENKGKSNQVNVIIEDYSRAKSGVSKETVKQQVDEYLNWVQDNFGTIVLRGIERGGEQAVNLPLDTVYVPLKADLSLRQDENEVDFSERHEIERLVARGSKTGGQIQLNQILSVGNRIIVTGGPGCGKTTVLLHLAWTLAKALQDNPKLAEEKLGITGELPLPIYIPLTRYADYLRKLPASASAEERALKTYVAEYLNERGANLEGLDPDFLSYLLRDGNTVLLLLDGMDEVPSEAERVLIRSKIVDLVSGRKNLRVVVTSRAAAYMGETVFGGDFQHLVVLPLEKEQVEKLVRAAYGSIYQKSAAIAKQHADDLLMSIEQLESERRRRLGDNVKSLVDAPIMIRMLLIVHYNDRKLPDQRADLYQKSVDVILRPDNVPDIKVREEIEKGIAGSLSMNREMLQHLAFHMHARGDERGREIDEAGLRKILEAEPTYQPYVNTLIEQTRQRGTLLEESGGLYRFMHLSFQEFLVGRYLAQNYKDADDLVSFLENDLIQDPWWREPILLLIGYQDLSAPIQARRTLLRMASLDEHAKERERDSLDCQLAACELAVTAYLECKSQASDLVDELRERLIFLHKQTETSNQWTPTILAAAADSLDRLGYIPEDLHTYIKVENFWIGKYPVTNLQYERFLRPENFENKELWTSFPKFSEPDKDGEIEHIGDWGNEAWMWLQKTLKAERDDVHGGVLYPRYWHDPRFGIARKTAPVVGISWYEANAYCKWLLANWDDMDEGKQGLEKPVEIRLPTETEWETAAGGVESKERFAWDTPGGVTPNEKVPLFANTAESGINRTTPVWTYPQGASHSYGLMDMSGDVWEWQTNLYSKQYSFPVWRGGSWFSVMDGARVASRNWFYPDYGGYNLGFRVVFSPHLPISEL
jgi:formylglycine-generating enzyme required for sulfatase activity